MSSSENIIYAFIDSQNLNLGIRSCGWVLDFKKFRLYLKNKYNVSKAFLFIGYISGNESLYANLQRYGYILIFKPTLEIKNGKKVKVKGNVDAELVLHAVVEKDNYDRAVIVSGDGDFFCLIEYLEKIEKLEALLVPNRKYSTLLRRFNIYVVDISELRESLEKKRPQINGRSKP
jgi:uncharacterized LabA/DUF88 family protein